MLLRCLAGLLWGILLAATAMGADDEGGFAIKGAGKKSCGDFTTAIEDKSRDYLLYGGWLEGYLSAYNQMQDGAYDMTPWQTTELLLFLIQQHCEGNPNDSFIGATTALLKSLFPIRLSERSELVKISYNNADSYYYAEILLRAKARLKQLGYYQGEPDARFTTEDARIFSEYQKKVGLTVTGVPDQYTLANLFLKRVKP